MRTSTTITALAAAATSVGAAAIPSWDPDNALWDNGVPANLSAGLIDPYVTASSNGTAVCINGLIPVYASTTKVANLNISLAEPANQTAVTELVVDMLMAGSTLAADVVGASVNVSGTYNISVSLCYPRATGINASSVQLLTHGVGFAKSYWDATFGYSYIDSAAANGYTTLSYDRLGVGMSAHPDPIQVVQAPFELAIAHSLVQMLRNGTFASSKFSHVVGVGHSFGSYITQGLTKYYVSDLDAAILTGFSLSTTGMPTFLTSLDLNIAYLNNPVRFNGLPNGYLIADNYIGNQFAFFKAPGFPPQNLALAEAQKNTLTLGELFTLSLISGNSSFTGPVDIVDGSNDWPFCMGNCTYPTNLVTGALSVYPNSTKTATYIVPLSGHGINLHYYANSAFAQIQAFIKSYSL